MRALDYSYYSSQVWWAKWPVTIVALALFFFTPWSACQQLICENRNPEGHTSRKTEGDGGFRIVVVGNYSTRGSYAPNDVYTVTIQGVKTRYSIQKFTEFLLVAESEMQSTVGQSGLMTTGIFHIIDDSHTRYSDTCPDGVTNVNMHPKSEISVLWTAPSGLVASCITFKATVVERPHVWYMDDGELTKVLCPPEAPPRRGGGRGGHRSTNRIPERGRKRHHQQLMLKNDEPVTPQMLKKPEIIEENVSGGGGGGGRVVETEPSIAPPAPAPLPPVTPPQQQLCCACDEAKYEVRFEGVWSRESHPKDFPENEWLLHFSDIIGASHSPDYSVWTPGEEASEGIRQVAEWGATRHLETELKSKSRFINTIIKAKGLWHPDEQGTTSAAFRVDKSHHLMSLVSMIGPSPDWIVGIRSFDLCLANCTWLEEADFELLPYDAGTDSGITYMSPNTPTQPRQKIRALTTTDPDDPRSPFHGLDEIKPFARVHIRRQRIYPKSCSDNSTTNLDAHEVYLTENSEDISRPECAVSEWTGWSDCSVTCGKGLRMRKRSYMIPMKADMFRCDRQLVEKEMCLGQEPSCALDNTSVFEEFDSICAVTAWSDWTPCSHTCGTGTRSRSRRYKNHMGRKKCNLEMTQTESCVISTECPNGNATDESEDCPMTPWSQWTPCSVSCGIGLRERTRFPLLTDEQEIGEKCGSISRAQRAPCTGEFGINCQLSMGDAKQICSLLPDPGSCRSNQTKFFYSVEKGSCEPFDYTGCKGNRNRFETEAECIQVCGFLRGMRLPQQPPPPPPSSPSGNPTDGVPTAAAAAATTTTPITASPGESPAGRVLPEPSLAASLLPAPHTTQADVSDGETEDDTLPEESEPPPKPATLRLKSTEQGSEPTAPKFDCVVSRWSSWAPCSVTCGPGVKTRSREVLIHPQNGGKKCPRLQKKKRCELDPC